MASARIYKETKTPTQSGPARSKLWMLEFEQEENPFRDHLAIEPIRQVKGTIAVPSGPGLGIEIDRGVIDRYRVA